jgi:hypothetical protein
VLCRHRHASLACRSRAAVRSKVRRSDGHHEDAGGNATSGGHGLRIGAPYDQGLNAAAMVMRLFVSGIRRYAEGWR